MSEKIRPPLSSSGGVRFKSRILLDSKPLANANAKAAQLFSNDGLLLRYILEIWKWRHLVPQKYLE